MKCFQIVMLITIILNIMVACASSRVVLSNNVSIDKYKYVIFGDKMTGDRDLDDIVMIVQNYISSTNLKVISSIDKNKVLECSDSILTPSIHVTSEKWDGGHTYITVTFYDYSSNQYIAVVKSSGIGMTVGHDQNIALKAIKKELKKLFKYK